MAYLLFSAATFNTASGLQVNDAKRIGAYVAPAAIVAVNLYIMLNTYRWDWLMVLITAISCLLIWFWTGVYTSFTSSFLFYHGASEVYGTLSFWALTLIVVVIALLPRFAVKSFQKVFMPYDVDIIREQIRLGRFDYLKYVEDPYAPPPPAEVEKTASSTASDSSDAKNDKPANHLPTIRSPHCNDPQPTQPKRL